MEEEQAVLMVKLRRHNVNSADNITRIESQISPRPFQVEGVSDPVANDTGVNTYAVLASTIVDVPSAHSPVAA